MAVAIRHPAGHIVTHTEPLRGLYTGRFRKVPLLRGLLVLAESLSLGMRSLAYSTRVAMEASDADAPPASFPERAFWGTMVASMAFMLAVFFAAPILVSNLLQFVGAGHIVIVTAEGVLRLAFFIGYILLISQLPEIRRVFQYHGAEHMTIHAYEGGRPLVPAEVCRFPKEHTRCGTSFLLVVVIVSLIAFFVFDLVVERGLVVRVLSRVALVVPIAAVSYEILRLGARFQSNTAVRALFAPNIALQALTTRVPDESQVEVAIAAFNATIAASTVAVGSFNPGPVPAKAADRTPPE